MTDEEFETRLTAYVEELDRIVAECVANIAAIEEEFAL